MNFFNIDCHISVIADIKNIFENLGHKVDSWSLSGHKWIFNLPECPSKIINENNWRNINQEMVDIFYKFHKDELDKYDAFICTYPPCFLKLFEKFNKPIIVIAATRYDYPFTDDPKRLEWLEHSLNNNQNLILIANNQFDQKYCEKFLKRKWEWIPSLCNYTNARHSKKDNKYILFSKFILEGVPPNWVHQQQLGTYEWSGLYSHKGIIHFPYNVSTMSIFEQYNAGVPLFFPSLDFSIKLIEDGVPLFSEIVFPNLTNNRQKKAFLNKEWLSLSDFYNGTIQCNYFDEEIRLEKKSKPINNKDIIFDKWEKLINNL
jgi:hypothetical protein